MSESVYLTDAAARDLDELYAGEYERGGLGSATAFLDRIEVALHSMADGALRTAHLPLLGPFGNVNARQYVSDGLRLVFRRYDQRVAVVLIAPVGRSFQALLERRVLEG